MPPALGGMHTGAVWNGMLIPLPGDTLAFELPEKISPT